MEFLSSNIKKSLDAIERWLSQNTYLAGDKITIADVSCACELIQGMFIEYDFSKWPKTSKWLNHMIYEVPEMLEVH